MIELPIGEYYKATLASGVNELIRSNRPFRVVEFSNSASIEELKDAINWLEDKIDDLPFFIKSLEGESIFFTTPVTDDGHVKSAKAIIIHRIN
jgi:hypothetical protein